MVIRDPAAIAAICGHNPPRAGCHLCKLAGTPVPIRRTPCQSLGDVVAGCATCGEGGKTRQCDIHGTCTLEKTAGKSLPVCADCPNYVPDPSVLAKAAAPDYGYGYSVPPFIPGPFGPLPLPIWQPAPMPEVNPTHSRLVITAVIGDEAEELHALTGPGQRDYAKAVGADYVVLRGKTQDERVPCAEKWRVKDYVPHYPGGTLWLDADVFVMPDAPDIFDTVPKDAIGMVDAGRTTPRLLTWAEPELAEVCRSQGVPVDPRANAVYWNSGVWVGRPQHAAYWEPPAKPFPVKWCVEEHWCRRNVFAHEMRVHQIDERFNWLWHNDRQFRQWEKGRPWFVHLAGMGNSEVEQWRQTNKDWRMALLRLMSAVLPR